MHFGTTALDAFLKSQVYVCNFIKRRPDTWTTFPTSHIHNTPHPQHLTSPTSHIFNITHPHHPLSRTSYIPKIPHGNHIISQISHVPNIPHPKHSTRQTPLTPNNPHLEHFTSRPSQIAICHIPNIPHPKHPPSRTSYIQYIQPPKQNGYSAAIIFIWLLQRNSNFIVHFIKFSNLTEMGNIWNQIDVLLLHKIWFNIFVKVFW